MAREINARIDALFVEGPDDGALVNALVNRLTGVDLAREPYRVVKARPDGGGDTWAVRQFKKRIEEGRPEARVGLIIDRDEEANDKWPSVSAILRELGMERSSGPSGAGAIVSGRYGIWMWPDNISHGDLETFVAGIIPQTPIFMYAAEACRIARDDHAAEYEPRHARKAALKVRSVWRDASAAGGYAHLVRNLPLTQTEACDAFIAWFRALFLTE
jgi:uncharacterized protein DUF3226